VYIQRFIQELYEYYGKLAPPSSSKMEIPAIFFEDGDPKSKYYQIPRVS
jgi:hypothetical protein